MKKMFFLSFMFILGLSLISCKKQKSSSLDFVSDNPVSEVDVEDESVVSEDDIVVDSSENESDDFFPDDSQVLDTSNGEEYGLTEYSEPVYNAVKDGVVDLSDMDSVFDSDMAIYREYDTGSDVGLSRESDGTIPFHIGDITFIYKQNIDIQLVTSDDSDFIYVKGLDDIHSSMSIGVYTGPEYEDQYNAIVFQNHVHYDANGNVYYTAQSVDNATWYYVFRDVADIKIIIVNATGNFTQRFLDIRLPVPDMYSVRYGE